MWREIFQKTTWKWILFFKAVLRISCYRVTVVWLFDWLTSDIKATFILLEWVNPDSTKPKMLFFPQQRRRTLWGRGRADKLFFDEDIYWRLLGTLFGFPPKKTLSWNRDKNNEIPKNSDWCSVCSFTSRFPFFFPLFATAMPKEGATKANRQQRMHNEHQHGRLRTTLEFYIIKWT